jgi:hypothetical protein
VVVVTTMAPPPVAAPSAADEVAYVDTQLREYLLYRGFTGALAAFDAERASLPPELDSADAVTDLLFRKHIPSLDVVGLTRTLALLRDRFFSRLAAAFAPAVARLETSIARLFVVHAVRSDRRDVVAELFEREGERLAAAGDDWHHWFGILYAKRPASDPRFAPFFAPSWADAVVVSARNFLSETMAAAPRPAILRFADARRRRDDDAAKIAAMERETDRLRAALLARERELADRAREAAASRGRYARRRDRRDEHATATALAAASAASEFPGPVESPRPSADAERAEPSDEPEPDRLRAVAHASPVASPAECSFVRRESFAWHSGAVTRARYSPDGDAVASGGADGTVRVWSPGAESTGPTGPTGRGVTSRDATIHCGAEIRALEWFRRGRDALLLVAAGRGSVRAWNLEHARAVCDAAGDESFPHCEDLRCSPTEHVFARAAATRDPWTRGGSSGVPQRLRGALEMWNAKIFAPTSTLPLGPDAAPVHEVAFNHNGKMLATAGADGAVRLFDLNAGKQIMSWTAHSRGEAATSLAFSADQNAVFSAGTDGVVTEWSLHRLRSVIHSVDVERARADQGRNHVAVGDDASKTKTRMKTRRTVALDPLGRGFALASSAEDASLVLLDAEGPGGVVRALPGHAAAVTCVDWHPTASVVCTGSADRTVQLTTLEFS